jgi:hypothetical protein
MKDPNDLSTQDMFELEEYKIGHAEEFEFILADNSDIDGTDSIEDWSTSDIELKERTVKLTDFSEYAD